MESPCECGIEPPGSISHGVRVKLVIIIVIVVVVVVIIIVVLLKVIFFKLQWGRL